MGSQEFTVLLAEDDDGHALLVRKNLERAGCSGPGRGRVSINSICPKRIRTISSQ